MKLVIDVPKMDITDLEDLHVASWECISWQSKKMHTAMIASVDVYKEQKPRTELFGPPGSPDKTRQRQAQQEYDLLCWGFPTDGNSPEALVTEQETAP
jgi:hypothetical protein